MDKLTELYAQTVMQFLSPIAHLLKDETVSEVMINGTESVYYEKRGKLTRADFVFKDSHSLAAAARNIAQFVGKVVDENNPRCDARLPDGSRVHVIYPPVSRTGISMAIRKFAKETLTVEKLISFGSLTEKSRYFLQICVTLAKNMMVSGGTSSGKTSLLNALSAMIDGHERIITVEDTAELQLQQDHILRLESKPADRHGKGAVTIRDLLHSCMRLRPDRIVIGEIRGAEAQDLLTAMTSGHSGSMSTTHANSAKDCCNRIETMALMAGLGLPSVAIRSQIASALDIVVQAERLHDGSRKVVAISEILGISDDGVYDIRDIFKFEMAGMDKMGKVIGVFSPTGQVPSFIKSIKAFGFKMEDDFWKPEPLPKVPD
jgi:pilus assembly protein CpaF